MAHFLSQLFLWDVHAISVTRLLCRVRRMKQPKEAVRTCRYLYGAIPAGARFVAPLPPVAFPWTLATPYNNELATVSSRSGDACFDRCGTVWLV